MIESLRERTHAPAVRRPEQRPFWVPDAAIASALGRLRPEAGPGFFNAIPVKKNH